MRLVFERGLAIAAAVPARLLARGATMANRDDFAERLRCRTLHVPNTALAATGPVWLVITFRGVLYPVFGADNLEQSWGGPTLLGAWATHLGVGVVALLAVSMAVAVATSRSGRHPESSQR